MGWNPWHGCQKISDGCRNCFVFMLDKRYGRNTEQFSINKEFDKPIRKGRNGDYLFTEEPYVFTCSNSDFFIKDADAVRDEAWRIIKKRSDLKFLIPTKRISRIAQCLPADWDAGYSHVYISCTIENQEEADKRLSIYTKLNLPHYLIQAEPLLGPLILEQYLNIVNFEKVTVEGEFGAGARECRYDWVKQIYDQCVSHDVSFDFRRTGDKYIDSKGVLIPRKKRGMQGLENEGLTYHKSKNCTLGFA